MHAELDRAHEADDHGGEGDVEDRQALGVGRLERLDVADLDRDADLAARDGGGLDEEAGDGGAGGGRDVQGGAGALEVEDGELLLLFDGPAGGGVRGVRVDGEEASRRLSMDLVKWFDCPWPVTATGTWCGTGLASA
ncbi:hypothetical protein ACFQHO_02045 [Actinomadura yumaensis]|uniref:hypothetical protein n=1 Tax=Actinomadura yumaensis TaxID=111807 RepID=UPI003615547B